MKVTGRLIKGPAVFQSEKPDFRGTISKGDSISGCATIDRAVKKKSGGQRVTSPEGGGRKESAIINVQGYHL